MTTAELPSGVREVKSEWVDPVGPKWTEFVTRYPIPKPDAWDLSKQAESLRAQPTRGYKSFAQWAQDVASAEKTRELPPRLKAAIGSSEEIDSSLGFMMPRGFADGFLKKAYGESLWGQATPLTADSAEMSIPYIDETVRAAGERQGGVRSYWITPGSQGTLSAAKAGQFSLHPRMLLVTIACTDELMRWGTAHSLSQVITEVATREIRFVLDEALIRGTGAGEPLGALNAACKITVPKEASQSPVFMSQNLSKMLSRLWIGSHSTAVWVANQQAYHHLLSTSFGTTTQAIEWFPGPNGRPRPHIHGLPLIPHESCSAPNAEGDLILIDPTQYVACTRGNVEQNVSVHVRFDYGEQYVRVLIRADGGPWWSKAVTPRFGTDTVSPIVTLQAR